MLDGMILHNGRENMCRLCRGDNFCTLTLDQKYEFIKNFFPQILDRVVEETLERIDPGSLGRRVK